MQIIEVKNAIKLLKNSKQNIAFLDIRERKQYVQGFAFGTINCPLSKFKTTIKDLVPDQSTTILFIGIKNSAQIKKVERITKSLNYKNVFQIEGDYKKWKKEKLPIWAGEYTFSKAFGEWIEITSEVKNLFPKQLKKIHQKPNNNAPKFVIVYLQPAGNGYAAP